MNSENILAYLPYRWYWSVEITTFHASTMAAALAHRSLNDTGKLQLDWCQQQITKLMMMSPRWSYQYKLFWGLQGFTEQRDARTSSRYPQLPYWPWNSGRCEALLSPQLQHTSALEMGASTSGVPISGALVLQQDFISSSTWWMWANKLWGPS